LKNKRSCLIRSKKQGKPSSNHPSGWNRQLSKSRTSKKQSTNWLRSSKIKNNTSRTSFILSRISSKIGNSQGSSSHSRSLLRPRRSSSWKWRSCRGRSKKWSRCYRLRWLNETMRRNWRISLLSWSSCLNTLTMWLRWSMSSTSTTRISGIRSFNFKTSVSLDLQMISTKPRRDPSTKKTGTSSSFRSFQKI